VDHPKYLETSQSPEGRRALRRWTWLLGVFGLLFIPVAAFLVTLIIGKYREISLNVGSTDSNRVDWWILTYAIEVVTLFWPLLILRLIVGTQLVKRSPNATSLNRAAFSALVGLSIPYVFAFSYLPYLLVPAPSTSGQGIGILLALVVTPVAVALAFVGWRIALFLP
jgi:hypothetical protein